MLILLQPFYFLCCYPLYYFILLCANFSIVLVYFIALCSFESSLFFFCVQTIFMPPPLRFSFCTSLLFFTLSPLAFSYISRLSHFSVCIFFLSFPLSPVSLTSHLSFTIPSFAYLSSLTFFVSLLIFVLPPFAFSLLHLSPIFVLFHPSLISLLSLFLCLF